MELKTVLIAGGIIGAGLAIAAVTTSINRDNAVKKISSDYESCYIGQSYIQIKRKHENNPSVFQKSSIEDQEIIKKGEIAEASCQKYYEFTKTWGNNMFEDPVERSDRNKLKLLPAPN